MAPRKATTATKAKTAKRKVEKENDEQDVEEVNEVPEKKNRGKAKNDSEKAKPKPKGDNGEEKKAKEKPTRKARGSKDDLDDEEEVPTEEKPTAKASKKNVSEKPKPKPKVVKDEEKKVKEKPSRKAKAAKEDSDVEEEEEEKPPASTSQKEPKKTVNKSEAAAKKPTATKATLRKRANIKEQKDESEESSDNEENEEDDEEPSAAKKAVKRKAPQTKDAPKPKAPVRNRTSTDWETIDFKCSTKTSKGKASNLHITSWNVDGLRAWVKKGGLNILEHDQPDILCLQETKCAEDKLPEELTEIEGYESLWCSSDKQGYAGVGILTKIKPLSVTYGIDSEDHDDEGRCIAAEFEKFYLVNVYVPNAGRKLVTLPKRLEWNKLFKEFIKKLDAKKPVIVCGDMNVAHFEIDLANPKTNTKNAGFTAEEREGMTEFLGEGYVDTFRKLYPDKEKAYTFWTYMSNARTKNVGWRLDYFIVSERFMEQVCDNVIHNEVLGSDHCPLTLFVNV